ncbi:MAG: AAA family ATPase, partial [Elusimicrobia bacterium]|nr:AAA family ATPase [Elusimicrobiota bacterium]
MFISKLMIENYRNFRSFSIKLKPFTLIIGGNNSGKTNLMSALSLIFTQEITAFRNRRLQIDDINYAAIYEFKKAIIEKQDTKFPEVKVEIELEEFKGFQSSVVGDWFIDKELKKARLIYLFRPKAGLELKNWIEENQKVINGTEEIEKKIKKL